MIHVPNFIREELDKLEDLQKSLVQIHENYGDVLSSDAYKNAEAKLEQIRRFKQDIGIE